MLCAKPSPLDQGDRLVTHSSKNSIENHFDKSFELEATLESASKSVRRWKRCKQICPKDVTIMHVRQASQRAGRGPVRPSADR